MNSLDYWQSRRGQAYAEQQSFRLKHANTSYHAQEVWLANHLARMNEQRPGQKIRLLDFGCGFGRIARLVCPLDFIDYYGYDFSQAMVDELKSAPPEAIAGDFDQRVRIAANLQEAFAKEPRFDLILTVSVMIHNPSDRARATTGLMLDYLAPGGQLVLIENPHTAVSAVESFWHGGCWCHAFPRYIDGKADMEILDRFADRHAIYLATPHETPRESRYLYRETPDAEAVSLDYAGILVRGLDRAVVNSETLTSELYTFDRDQIDLVGRLHDLTEERDIAGEKVIVLEKGHAEALAQVAQLTQEKAQLEDRLAEANRETAAARTRFSDRQNLLQDLGRSLTTAHRMCSNLPAPRREGSVHPAAHASVLWNDRRDTQYANDLPEMQRVLHVFHQEWVGIRAAAGSLGGQKLAITADRALSNEDILQIYETIAGEDFSRIIFHGLSENAYQMILFLYRRGFGEKIFLIKHGSTVQWVSDPEREMAIRAIELRKEGIVAKLHVMKQGFDMDMSGLFRPILLNMSPRLGPQFSPAMSEMILEGVAFSAGWSGWIKNVHSNLFGAALSEKIGTVWHYAPNIVLPSPLNDKLVRKPTGSREETFRLIAMATLCLNVSLTDCDPMVNIEAQALDRPCLRGNLNLDALEDHPYVAATLVSDPSSVACIRDRINALLDIPREELVDMIRDYREKRDAISRARYREFLEL
ncbi:methyltransferase [Hyphomonas sp. NPDC076900]|uniref:class I SAM-dependent methyltransferase n=1 Tax=Hyphomonas sp. NPDC076900 TaxID=3390570 RepID=UPI003D04A4CF